MNKRQAKKAAKKVSYPLADELFLITLTPEEYQKAMEDYDQYVQKYCRYKHYRDKHKNIHRVYYFPAGEAVRKMLEPIKNARTYHTIRVTQSLDTQSLEQLKKESNIEELLKKIRQRRICSGN